ncbi:hypothetical protein [Streptomyces avermitilis]|uniref:hypothetical protein n=1 Tax=Streptomyces avermitilis TaxID=33903 RepID=UPI0037FA7335
MAAVGPWAGAVCAVPAVMVAAERVHTGAHCPSDVAVGAAIDLAAAALGTSGSAAGPLLL